MRLNAEPQRRPCWGITIPIMAMLTTLECNMSGSMPMVCDAVCSSCVRVARESGGVKWDLCEIGLRIESLAGSTSGVVSAITGPVLLDRTTLENRRTANLPANKGVADSHGRD